MNKTILSLDIATKCGWCLHKSNNEISSGVWKMAAKSKERDYIVVKKLRDHLDEVLKNNPDLSVIVFENVEFSKFRLAYASFNRLLGVLQLWSCDHNIELVGIPVKTLKKFATGNGNADKQLMLSVAVEKWPTIPFVDDNEVDARWLLSYYLEQIVHE